MVFSALLIAFTVVVLVNCVYYVIFAKYAFAKHAPLPVKKHPVSVIVCAKNEAENLKQNIPIWLEQDYPDFELILINDASSDETPDVIELFAENDKRVKVVQVENNEAFWANKKYALTLGIKKAKNNHFLFTDADCKPASTSWISHMSAHFSEKKQLVLGYGAYEKHSTWLNKLIRFETFLTALQYFSFTKIGLPYMGVGRNLAYTSALFYDNNGFMSHMHIRSGDDDLFVNEVANKSNTAICDTPQAFTISAPKTTWSSWRQQKKRHLTTATHYKSFHKLLLGGHYLFNFLFWVAAIITLIFDNWPLALILIGFRFAVQYISMYKALHKLRETGLLVWLPLLELFLVCFQLTIFISNLFSKPKHWK